MAKQTYGRAAILHRTQTQQRPWYCFATEFLSGPPTFHVLPGQWQNCLWDGNNKSSVISTMVNRLCGTSTLRLVTGLR